MSEAAAAEAPKKKKGKLPIIVALVAVLAGGGFFMMKGKKKEDAGPKKIAIADAEVELADEFLVNLADNKSYVRCKIVLKFKEGYKAEEVTKHAGEIADAINLTLKATEPEETKTVEQMKGLKRRIAAAINSALGGGAEEEHKDEQEHKSSKTKEIVLGDKKKKPAEDEEKPEIPPDWDSLEGPVLKVLFKTFATQ